jgi:N-dimethylarginine dimethylaminohydrolase
MDESKTRMITSHAEYGPIRSLILKKAGDAFVSQAELAQNWKELNFTSEPDFARAGAEYELFSGIVTGQGKSRVTYLPEDPAVTPDSLYCRDASLATDRGIVLCRMGKPARATEPTAVKNACLMNGIPVLGSITAPGKVEGGDCAWVDIRTLAVGLTYRTNEEGIVQLRSLLGPLGVTVWEVHLPHYRGPSDVFHLMSVFSPIGKNLAVVYSPLMPVSFRKGLLDRGYTLVEVPDNEFDSMGCNVLSIGVMECAMVKGNPITRSRVEAAGCKVIEYQGDEISLKGGGGPTCLTRPIQREI